MKHWMKRSLAMLLCLVMLCTLVPAFAAQAEEIEIIPIEEESGEDIVLIDEPAVEPAAEPAAVSNGDGTTTYRALLVGEVNFSWETANRNKGDVTLLKNMLGQVTGPQGGSYAVTCKYDLSNSGLRSAISSSFGAADDDDVSLFFIATHGVTNIESGIYAGELVTIGADGNEEYMTLSELATCLKAVPGKVIVLLGSCGSGAAIVSNGKVTYVPNASSEADERFNEAAIRAFAEADPAANTGEFRESKFYVMTAAAHQESSWGQESSDPYNYFPYYFAQGAGTGMPADANGNGTVTMVEMFDYVYTNALGPYYDGTGNYYQHTQMYPENSTYALFSAQAKPIITTQPKTTTICAGTDVSFKVAASGATSYQWYYRTSSSGSWYKCTVASATTTTLKYTKVSLGHNGYQYRCKVSNASGYVYTNAATLKVQEAPVITTQPKDTTISSGDDVSFTVKASGALSYQWYWRENSSDSWKKSTVSTATSATLKYSGLTTAKSGRQYRCMVANDKAYVYTNTVTLTVLGKPAITTQPASVTASVDTTAKFTVKATGATTYQWYYRTSSSGSWAKSTLTGCKTATLSVKATAARSGYQYRCRVSNDYGYVYSSAATLTVQSVAPIITSQPKDTTINAGEDVSFTVKATNALSYQWYYRESSSDSWKKSTVSTATTPTLKYSNLGVTKNGRQYRCLVANDKAYVYTNIVTLTVIGGAKPTITTQPASVSAAVDATVKFTVKASGATGYQWYYRTSSSGSWAKSTLTGCTTATLSVKATTARNGYQYRCKVSNAGGYVYSSVATLTVQAENPVTYRALLIGQTYNSVTKTSINPLFGDLSQGMMYEVFNNVNGASGGFIWTDDWTDVSHDDMQLAIEYAFADADTNDVSIFYYNGHGVVTGSKDSAAGALVTVESDGGIGYVYTYELASWLSAVPGKVVVLLDSCGAGAAIVENGAVSFLSNEEAAAQFGALAISAFAEKDAPVDNAGEFRSSKFYVLAAAPYNESSYAYSGIGGEMTYYLKQGLLSGMPADANGNGKVTLQELYQYIDSCAWQDQTTCVYPENSSYSLFAKK